MARSRPFRTLSFRLEHIDKNQRRLVLACMTVLNEALQREAFTVSVSGPHLVSFSPAKFVDDSPDILGHVTSDNRGHWTVSIRPNQTHAMLAGVLLHELGHVLGLGHNAWVSSIMHRYPPAATSNLRRMYAHEIALRCARRK